MPLRNEECGVRLVRSELCKMIKDDPESNHGQKGEGMSKILLVFGVMMFITAAAWADFDMGDLTPCNYPTQEANPSHTISGKAWLGQCVTDEVVPWPVNGDACDDGVNYLFFPWEPCTFVQVEVLVTHGPNYDADPLFLNGWKDGNLDGDFCDTLCDGVADEWIVQDAPVTAAGLYVFTFIDPGVTNMGTYDGVFRWRLTGRTIGRMGFGGYDPFNCVESPMCGTFISDSLGEVEDYWLDDVQLRVDLSNFDAIAGDGSVTLNWTTATEDANDHFEIVRDNVTIATIEGAGTSATEHSYSWTEEHLANGTLYSYTLYAVDMSGHREILGTESATPSAAALITAYALHQNYPNPFNPETQISYDLVNAGHVTLTVYNMLGQEVAMLVNGMEDAGHHAITFDASHLPAALYLYKLNVNGFSATQKMLLIK